MSTAGLFVCDESEWPLVRVQAPSVAPDDAEFRALLGWYTSVLRRRRPFVMLFELGAGAQLSVGRRDELRRHAREHAHLLTESQLGLGIVARSAYHRATARALFWIVKPPYPVEIFPDWQTARRWALRRAGSDPVNPQATALTG